MQAPCKKDSKGQWRSHEMHAMASIFFGGMMGGNPENHTKENFLQGVSIAMQALYRVGQKNWTIFEC